MALIRGTTADPAGNVTMEREALTLDNLAIAMAAKNSRGLVIARRAHQRRLSLDARGDPRRPGGCVVVGSPRTTGRPTRRPTTTPFGPTAGAAGPGPARPLDERKIVARRCAFELPPGGAVNLGIGMPEGVAAVAAEEKVLKYLTLTAEPGIIGGLPQGGLNFGAASTQEPSSTRTSSSTSMMAAGSISPALGSRRSMPKATSTSASSAASSVAPAASSTSARMLASGVRRHVHGRRAGDRSRGRAGLRIMREGKSRKFVEAVEQITFSGDYAAETGQPVFYVTERCVSADAGRHGID